MTVRQVYTCDECGKEGSGLLEGWFTLGMRLVRGVEQFGGLFAPSWKRQVCGESCARRALTSPALYVMLVERADKHARSRTSATTSPAIPQGTTERREP